MHKTLILFASIIFALDLAVGVSLIRLTTGMQIDLLDVRQGDAILITTPEQNHILVDGGPGNDVVLELSETLPYLFSEIDLLVMTHPHADHIEGLIPVLDRFKVGAVLISAPDYDSLAYEHFLKQIEGMNIFIADDNTDFKLGETVIDVLYPFEPFTGQEVENVNNVSPVMLIKSGESRILLSGDAEVEVEDAVLASNVDIQADILKAGHHGSRTASSLAFLEAVSPEILLVSVGEGNSFEHPHKETLEKAADLDIEILRTDLEGRISIFFEKTFENGTQYNSTNIYSWIRSILAPKLRSFSPNFS